jgi:hypothetical protein
MKNISSLVPCFKNIQRTTSILLTAEEILKADEPNVKPVGKGFITKYHHFSYGGNGKSYNNNNNNNNNII